ncbi:MAG: hypothetical protein VX677_12610, partial [Candidatus Poribacteria bacterium]|nr:hypothetical protein [Candidatus Poribacteria bacterium]
IQYRIFVMVTSTFSSLPNLTTNGCWHSLPPIDQRRSIRHLFLLLLPRTSIRPQSPVSASVRTITHLTLASCCYTLSIVG